MTRRYIACLLLVLLNFYSSFSQNRFKTPYRYKFQKLNIPLENSRIQSIEEDHEGYIWIGTLGGLYRFDGLNLTSYLPSDDSTSLSNAGIEGIFEDSKDRLWVGTEDGIHLFNREYNNFKSLQIQDEFLDDFDSRPARTQKIIEDKNGKIWISNDRAGLQYYNEVQQQFYAFFQEDDSTDLRFSEVVSLAEDNDGNLWIATRSAGLAKIEVRTKHVTRFKAGIDETSISSNNLNYTFIDNKNRLWVGTDDRGVSVLNLNIKTPTIEHYSHDYYNVNSLQNNEVVSIFQERNGNIWVCNENGGLHMFDERQKQFVRYFPDSKDPDAITSNSIKTVFQDNQGRLWVGSSLEGIDISDKYLEKFELFQMKNKPYALNNNIIRSFLEDEHGNFWIGTDGGGLNYFDRKTNEFKSFMKNPLDSKSITSDAVLHLEYDEYGRMWAGTWQGGINVLDESTKSFWQMNPNDEKSKRVFHVFRDSRDRMWVGDQVGGLSIMSSNGEIEANYMTSAKDSLSLSGNSVITIVETSQGEFWVGTGFSGLNRAIEGPNGKYSFIRYQANLYSDKAIPSPKINQVFQDSRGELWVANEEGVSKYIRSTDSFKNYSTEHGLINNAIKSIQEDHNGMLWFASAKGLTKFNPSTEKMRNYTSADGLQLGNFARYSSFKSSKNELLFGGYGGFNIFHPDSIQDNPYAPIVKITGLDVMNEEMEIGVEGSPLMKDIRAMAQISLLHKQSIFTLKYMGISFTQAIRNQYAYRLIGFNDQWTFAGSRREATFTNLNPGTYTFQVKAANNDGVWSTEYAEINIVIIPPWWNTYPVYIVVTALLILIVIFYIRRKTRVLKLAKLELEVKINERTERIQDLNSELAQSNQELFKSNDQLVSQKEELKSNMDKLQDAQNRLATSEKMASLGVFTAGIAHEINNPINFISGASSSLRDIISKEKNKKLLTSGDGTDNIPKLLDAIGVGVERTTSIIRSLKNYVHQGPEEFKTSNIIMSIEDALNILGQHQLHNVKIDKVYSKEVNLYCNIGKINQVFVNLIGNAIDAIENEGIVTIQIDQTDHQVSIAISDNGKGIEKSSIPKLFDPFYTTKEVGKGTGLGLYLVYGIIEQHRGRIYVESDVGKGTTFEIKIPKRVND